MSVFLNEALRLATLGYPVFPCFPKTKKPANHNGVSGATCDPEAVSDWWRKNPDANIGLACHYCLIIDVDVKQKKGKRGDEDISILIKALGPLPSSPMAKTGGGGWHLFFQRPKEEIVGRKAVEWQGRKTGIDIQVGNQYVVAPPSVHESGNLYEWITPLVPVAELPCLPQKWIDDFLPKKGAKKSTSALPVTFVTNDQVIERCRKYVATIEPAIAGQNGSTPTLSAANAIFWGFGLSEEQGWPILVEYSNRCLPPWSESELKHKMRDALEKPVGKARGWLLESKQDVHPDVDLSGLLKQKKPSVLESKPIPEDLYNVPGFVERVMSFCLSAAPYPSKPLAFCGAMALQSYLCSRKVMEPGGLRPNLYLLGLGISGAGKAFPRKVNAHVLSQIGCGGAVGNQISSGQGLEDAIEINHKMLFQADEFDNMLRAIASAKDSNYTQLLSMLLQLYSAADEIHVKRAKAGVPPKEINQPGLVIFGTATPECFFDAMTPTLLTNGLFSRCIIIDVGERGRRQRSRDHREVPLEIIEEARWWVDFNPGPVDPKTGKPPNLNDENPIPYKIAVSDEGYPVFDRFAEMADDEYDAAARAGDNARAAVWTRAFENMMRLAIVYTCSRDRENLVMDVEVAKWATRFGKHLVERMLALVRGNIAENAFHKECLKMKRALRGEPGQQLSHSEAARKMKALSSKQFREMMETLVDQGAVVVLPLGYSVGYRGCSYQLIE